MSLKVNLCKFLLSGVGAHLPLRRHPGGKLANQIRCALTRGIVQSMGRDCNIEKGAEIGEGCIFGDKTAVGPDCLVQAGTIFKGNNMMAPDVHIYTVNHLYSAEKHRFEGEERKPVTIGENVWLGYGAILLPGVTIGRNTIIGAGSVVTKDIPSGVMAAGNPCTVKKIIDPEIYEADLQNA